MESINVDVGRDQDAAWDGVNGIDGMPTLDVHPLEFWPAPPSRDAVLRRPIGGQRDGFTDR